MASLNEQNPLIKQYSFKLSDYNIDRKMKLEKLKPKINVEYNFLAKSFNYLNDYGYGLPLTNNYKWGVSFSMPLFLRQERADLKLTKLKIQNTEWQKDTKELELKNKIQMIVNKINTLTSQIQLSKDMLNNWNTLYKAETERFALGESSLFLINSRELKLLETNEKLLSLLSKYQEADLEFTYWKFRF